MSIAKQKTQLVYLNSKYASKNNGAYHSDLSFPLSRPIQKPKDTDLCIKVSQFVFPVSFYNVNPTNNQLKYYINGVESDIDIPEGCYDATTLENYLSTAFTDDGVSVAYDETSMTFSFTHDTLEIVFDESSTCLSLLGFTEGEDHVSALIYGKEILASEYPIDLSPTKCIYIAIPNLSINNLNGNTGQRTPVIASIPVDADGGDMEVFNNDVGLSIHTQEETISEFHIRIYDDDLSSLINFQNSHWTMTLEVAFVPST